MKILKIIVSVPDKIQADKYKEVGRFSVVYDDSMAIDFNLLLRAFAILYPQNKIVEFKII